MRVTSNVLEKLNRVPGTLSTRSAQKWVVFSRMVVHMNNVELLNWKRDGAVAAHQVLLRWRRIRHGQIGGSVKLSGHGATFPVVVLVIAAVVIAKVQRFFLHWVGSHKLFLLVIFVSAASLVAVSLALALSLFGVVSSHKVGGATATT